MSKITSIYTSMTEQEKIQYKAWEMGSIVGFNFAVDFVLEQIKNKPEAIDVEAYIFDRIAEDHDQLAHDMKEEGLGQYSLSEIEKPSFLTKAIRNSKQIRRGIRKNG